MKERIGVVTHYYNKLGVAAVMIKHGRLTKGDKIHISGHCTDLEQTVDSMELEHQPIVEACEGQNIGIKVLDYVRENDYVYKSQF